MSGLVLLGFLGLFLVLGLPIGFAVGLASAASLLLRLPADPALTTVAQRMATGLDSFSLLAIPFFVLAGEVMNRGGVARRLVDLGQVLLARLPGSMLYVNVAACILFGAISGSAVAAAAAVGGFMLPLLEARKIRLEDGAAVNIAASTTGLLIPPSNVLIVYSLASGGVSIAALFVAGYGPGLLLGMLLTVAIAILAKHRGYAASAADEGSALLPTLLSALPALGLIVVVMGGIVSGIFTATEASGVAVVYALALALFGYRELRLQDLPKLFTDAACTTGVVLLLVATSMALSWVMAFDRLPQLVASSLLGLADSPALVLLVINVVLLLVGTFLDMTPAVLIFVPIFLPVATELGIDPIHFGMIMVLNLCVGLCTPPVGTVLFVGLGVARIPLLRVLPPLLLLYGAMILALVLTTLFPEISLWLPRQLGL
ncbi:MAG: TRAP transporter large permease [Acidobacteriota bacterium]